MTQTISNATVTSLAAKLDSLELSEVEAAALDAIMQRGAEAEAEVEGFGVVFEVETTVFDFPEWHEFKPSTEVKVAAALGLFPSRNVWTDMRPSSS